MPRRSSSSSWMMIRGVTIIIRLCVSRPMPTFLNSRLMYGSLLKIGTPNSLRPSLNRLMPPSSTVPPSGTLTVVLTVTNEKFGNCTVMPSVVVVASSVLAVESPPSRPWLLEALDFLVVVFEPANVNSLHVADLAEERHDGQPHEPPIVRDDGLHGQRACLRRARR